MLGVIFSGVKLSIKFMTIIKRVMKVIFPEFSNKLTWLVVGAGIGLTSTSLLVSIIDALAKKQFNFSFIGPYDPVVGIVLIALGLIHNYFIHKNKLENFQPSIGATEVVIFDELHRKMLTVEGLLNDSFLDRRLWNEIQEQLNQLRSYYFKNKLSLTNELDESTLELIMVGCKVLSVPINNTIPSELVTSFRSIREDIVLQIRSLKGANK